jgi:hypothetical protein
MNPPRRSSWNAEPPRASHAPQEALPYLHPWFEGPFGFPSMGQAVEAHLDYTLSDLVLTATVRRLRCPERLPAA